jgi:hypothetical protein
MMASYESKPRILLIARKELLRAKRPDRTLDGATQMATVIELRQSPFGQCVTINLVSPPQSGKPNL